MNLRTKLGIFLGDIAGGVNSAVIALPQALAFGVATGFGAGAGLWGAIILCFVAGILGTKTPMISGTTGPVAIVIASIMHALNQDINSVILIIAMAGIIQIILSATQLLNVVKYVPYPVISGFMNGVGIIIILLQLNPLIGYSATSNTIESVQMFLLHLSDINYDAFILGLLTLFIVFFTPRRVNKIVPSSVIALLICTYVSVKFGFDVSRINSISVELPGLITPKASVHELITYLDYALTLAVILSSESLLTGLVCDSLTKIKNNPKIIIAAQGIGNVFCSLTGSLPGSAATMRTVAGIKTGAKTKFATVVSPIVLLLFVFKFSNFVAEIPLAVLAGILIKIGYDIIDVKLLKVIKYASKEDLYVLWIVFLLTVFYNLIVAVGAGITLAALLYAKKVADNAKLVQRVVYDKDIIKIEKCLEEDFKHKIRVVHISGQFFFGSATQLISQFDEFLGTRYLILNYDACDLLDISAIFAFEDIVLRLKDQHIRILLVLNNKELYKQLEKHNIIHEIGEHHIFYSEIEAINFAKRSLERKFREK
ncbi:SulP family inorganic anion transporter [bacterium]|nr:SulP family inorganic anion transporter [bacterium]